MTEAWELVLHEKAMREFISSRGADRRKLERAFESLAKNPTQKPDKQFEDSGGRPLSVIPVGRLAVIYWLDVFVKEIRILSVERIS